MPKIPANRIAAGLAVIAGVAGALAPVVADLDTTSVAGLIAGLLAIVATVDRYLKGSQEWDRLQAQTASAVGPVLPAADVGLVDDPEVDDIPVEDLPSDEEELAAPPPDDPGRP